MDKVGVLTTINLLRTKDLRVKYFVQNLFKYENSRICSYASLTYYARKIFFFGSLNFETIKNTSILSMTIGLLPIAERSVFKE